jgi:hypothetical protein
VLSIKGYNLQSFALGTKLVRAFSFDSNSGTIIDYVLAECGAEKSPFPAEFYRRISFGEGVVKLQDSDDTASYVVSRDNILISERTASADKNLGDAEGIVKKGKHLIPNTLSFMNNPKARLLGMVWQYAQKDTSERERFKHPVAERISRSLLKLELKGNESPAETNIRLAFRKKLPTSYVVHGQDDFLNVTVNIGDVAINDLWADTEDTKPRTEIIDDTRIGFISFDVQIFFDPRRKIGEKAIDAHWEECQRMRKRLSELLRGVGFEAE